MRDFRRWPRRDWCRMDRLLFYFFRVAHFALAPMSTFARVPASTPPFARVLRHSRVRAPVGSSRGALVVRAGPFRNPFDRDKSKPDKAEDGVTGFRALADRVRKGRDKAAKDGFQSVLADVRDGISDRNYGNGGSWPEAAEARRTKRCPLCGASTAEALRAAEEKGIVANPSADPVEKALLGQHPLGWCASCAESNRLLDTTSGF